MANIEKFQDDLTPQQLEKMRKQMVWIGCISITMLFAGLISAYIVQSSDKVWIKHEMPQAFTISTFLIILSSVMLYLALRAARASKHTAITGFIGATFLAGIAFTVFQFKGWNQMVEAGNYISGGIINDNGLYGKEFVLEYNGAEITHDGEQYFIGEEPLQPNQVAEVRSLGAQLCGNEYHYVQGRIKYDGIDGYQVRKMSNNTLVDFKGNDEIFAGDVALSHSQKTELFNFGLSIHLKMEFFKLTGKYGKDFQLMLNGEMLDFSNKKFYYPELVLNEEEQSNISADFIPVNGKQCKIEFGKIIGPEGNEISDKNVDAGFLFRAGKTDFHVDIINGKWIRRTTEVHQDDYLDLYSQSNTASSYLWAITVLHFLHLFGGLLYLLSLFIKALNKRFDAGNHRNIKTGGIYWHYLGGLWLILFFFFQYIH